MEKKLVFLLLAIFALTVSANAASFQNGDFESATLGAYSNTYYYWLGTAETASPTILDGWTFDNSGGSSGRWMTTNPVHQNGGSQSLLASNFLGAFDLSQTFDVVDGAAYEVTFDAAGWADWKTWGYAESITVDVDGTGITKTLGDFAGLGDAVFVPESFEFTASGSTATMSITTTDSVYGLLIDNISVTRASPAARNVSPIDDATAVSPVAVLEWKAPLETGVPDPNTISFLVYCDPCEFLVNSATYDSHAGIAYYSDQLLTGNIATDPVQTFDPAGLLDNPDITYHWRVDTRMDDIPEPNVVFGNTWSFTTRSLSYNAVEPISPWNYEPGVALDTKFTWTASPDIALLTNPVYKVYLDPNEFKVTSGDPSVLDVDLDGDNTDPNHTPTLTLDNDATYFWRADVVDNNGAGPVYPGGTPSGTPWRFYTITASPVIQSNPVSLTVPMTGDVEFEVTAINAVSWQWKKDGITDINDGGRYTVTNVAGKSTLKITGVILSDEGDYTCTASKPTTTPAVSAPANLVFERLYGHWEFDGDLTDSVQDTVPGAPVNNAWSMDGDPNYTTGHVGSGALAFIDTGAEAEPNNFKFFGRGVTVSVWMKRDAGDPPAIYYGVITHSLIPSAGRSIWLSHGDPYGYGTADGPVATGPEGNLQTDKPNTGAWQYAATTYEVVSETEAVWSVYVDGAWIYSGTVTPTPYTHVEKLNFGWRQAGYTSDIAVDNVKVYTYALTPTQIAQEYIDDDPVEDRWCIERPDMDIAPVGNLDCVVDLLDFAEFALDWLEDGNIYEQ